MMKQTEQDAKCRIFRVNGYMRIDWTIQLFYTFEVFHTKISEENDCWEQREQNIISILCIPHVKCVHTDKL